MATTVKQTPLYSLHRKLGARMTEFGGFEMPLSYSGIIEEHRAVRAAAGIFDLSHMGEFELRGRGALSVLERLLTNAASRLTDGQAQYTLMCAEDGGTLEDLIVYRLGPDRFMLCVNAANIAPDYDWLRLHCSGEAELLDMSDDIGLVAIQGPQSEAILSKTCEATLGEIRRFHTAIGMVAGISCMVARTGYTGEDGFEIFVAAHDAARVFEAVLAAGAEDGLKPCGLGARDTLRMEAGLPLYGHELDRSISPLEAGLVPFVKLGRGFIGEPALTAQRDGGLRRHLSGIQTEDGKSIARQGYKLFCDSREIGVVTSGTYAPSFDRPLAIGLIDATAGVGPGQQVDVEIRKKMVPARLARLPFYRHSTKAT